MIKTKVNKIKVAHPVPLLDFCPNNTRLTFRFLPDFVVGMPVTLAKFRFALVIPVARFQENPFLRAIKHLNQSSSAEVFAVIKVEKLI